VSSLSRLPLDRTSLREKVATALRAAIISGEMQPGQIYSAPSLGARFGVSATPVREAMLDLLREGMVSIAPNKGFRVTEIDDAELDQITQLRLLIEPPVGRLVTPLIPTSDLPELRRLAQVIVTEAEAGDLPAYTEADRVFHLTLLGYANNPRIVELIGELRGQTRLTGLTRLVESGQLVDSAREHLVIVDAIASRDADAVERLLQVHIGHVRELWA